jgi:hypothetical protein
MALRSLAFAALLLSSCSRASDEQAEVRLDAAGALDIGAGVGAGSSVVAGGGGGDGLVAGDAAGASAGALSVAPQAAASPGSVFGAMLLDSCKDGRAEDALQLIAAGADVDFVGEQGRTPLIWACIKSLEAVIARLVEAGAALDLVDEYGQSALLRASAVGHAAVVQLLLQKGAQVDLVDKSGGTALTYACFYGQPDAAQLLAARMDEFSLNVIDETSKTALDWAYEGGYKQERVAELAPAVDAIRARGGRTREDLTKRERE